MQLFLSRYQNQIDKKGRVSIPANYRYALSLGNADDIQPSVIMYPSIKNNCIEACSTERLETISKIIEHLDPYSEERDAFETLILGESIQLLFDKEGRVILPKSLIEHAGLSEQVTFVGKGQVFELWQPELFEAHLRNAKSIAHNNRSLLKNIQEGKQNA